MRTLQEITDAVDQGIVVYWKNKAYKVESGPLGYDVVCTLNGHCDGLNDFYDPQDFFTFSEAMEYQA
jgi:hypothetical protein